MDTETISDRSMRALTSSVFKQAFADIKKAKSKKQINEIRKFISDKKNDWWQCLEIFLESIDVDTAKKMLRQRCREKVKEFKAKKENHEKTKNP